MQTESIARGLIQSIFAYALYHTYAHAEAQQPAGDEHRGENPTRREASAR